MMYFLQFGLELTNLLNSYNTALSGLLLFMVEAVMSLYGVIEQ